MVGIEVDISEERADVVVARVPIARTNVVTGTLRLRSILTVRMSLLEVSTSSHGPGWG